MARPPSPTQMDEGPIGPRSHQEFPGADADGWRSQSSVTTPEPSSHRRRSGANRGSPAPASSRVSGAAQRRRMSRQEFLVAAVLRRLPMSGAWLQAHETCPRRWALSLRAVWAVAPAGRSGGGQAVPRWHREFPVAAVSVRRSRVFFSPPQPAWGLPPGFGRRHWRPTRGRHRNEGDCPGCLGWRYRTACHRPAFEEVARKRAAVGRPPDCPFFLVPTGPKWRREFRASGVSVVGSDCSLGSAPG